MEQTASLWGLKAVISTFSLSIFLCQKTLYGSHFLIKSSWFRETDTFFSTAHGLVVSLRNCFELVVFDTKDNCANFSRSKYYRWELFIVSNFHVVLGIPFVIIGFFKLSCFQSCAMWCRVLGINLLIWKLGKMFRCTLWPWRLFHTNWHSVSMSGRFLALHRNFQIFYLFIMQCWEIYFWERERGWFHLLSIVTSFY